MGTLQVSLMLEAMTIQNEGVGKYLDAVKAENDNAKRMAQSQQPRPNQVQAEQGAAQMQAQPQPIQQVMGGQGGLS